MRKLERLEVTTGKLLLPKKQRRVIHEAPGLFSASAPGTLRRWRKVCRSLSTLRPDNPRQRLLAATVALAIECRISDPRVLADVAGNKHFRLVSFESALYFEHGDFSSNFEAPCRRFRIFGKAAQWISGLPPDKAWQTKDPLPHWLESIFDELRIHPCNNKVGDLIRELTKFIDQVNAQTLPGVLCGVLSGRLVTRSLGWRDWVRLKTGRRIDLSKHAADSSETGSAIDIDEQLAIGRDIKPISVNDARQAAQQFFGNLRDLITASEKNPDKRKNPRRHLVMQLHAEVKQAQKRGVPASAILLGAWIHDLAQPVGRRAREPSTLLRYLTALSGRFEIEFTDVDLLNADDDGLTDAYSRLLTCKDKLAGPYEASVLAMFHRWLRRCYGIEDPDWDDLPVAVSFDVIDPGFITEEDYRASFEHLGRHKRLNDEDRLAAQMLLLLGYRFGFRRREALGLLRKDWDDSAGKVILTVEPNAFRGLKTSSSRRQVPQLIPTDEREEKAIKDMLVRHTARNGDRDGELLLPCSSWIKVTSVVIETLKMVTGNPYITLHHARHSAANMAALNALGVSLDPWCRPDSKRYDFELTLLGANGISRRHAWAVSRYLGHAGPNTTFKSYLHFLLDWAGVLIISEEDSSVDPSHRFYVLDALPTLPEIEAQADESEPQEATFSKVLQAFRLYLRGYDAVDIQSTLKIPDTLLDRILQAIGTKNEKTRLGELASGIQESAWARIVAWAGENDFNCKSYGTSTEVSVTDILKMVGATSQLLAWKEEHFSLLRWALHLFNIEESQYDVYGSAGAHQGTLELAKATGFKVASRPRWVARKNNQRQSLLQIDSVADGQYNTPVDSRIAIVFKENASGDIRNRNQLAVLFAAAVLAINPD
jgi:integrase